MWGRMAMRYVFSARRANSVETDHTALLWHWTPDLRWPSAMGAILDGLTPFGVDEGAKGVRGASFGGLHR